MTLKTLFYSWQSDLNPKEHHYLIREALTVALKDIKKDIDFELSLDKDTEKTSGSPNIVDTIFRKIRAADIFVADVTIINPDSKGRKTCNPNVLIELGYAIKAIGWERIICVANVDNCRLEDLPFDIRNNRTSTYRISKAGIKNTEKALKDTMSLAIKSIIDDYEGILERLVKDDYIEHDKGLFRAFNELCSQSELYDGLNFLCTTLSVYATQYRLWKSVRLFGNAIENRFLNKEIQGSFESFVICLSKAHLSAAQKLFLINNPNIKWTDDYTRRGIEITADIQFEIDQTQRHAYPDFLEIVSDDLDEYEKRRFRAQQTFNEETDEVLKSYEDFRLAVKKNLLI